jgi:hypothetical protein
MEGSNDWWPLEGSIVWWPMEGEGETQMNEELALETSLDLTLT